MYVIFPAEDVVACSLITPAVLPSPPPRPCSCPKHSRNLQLASSGLSISAPTSPVSGVSAGSNTSHLGAGGRGVGRRFLPWLTFGAAKSKFSKPLRMHQTTPAGTSTDLSLRQLIHPTFNDQLKAYNAATFKLSKTVSDFSQDLSRAYEEHAANLQLLVTSYRKKNVDLRKERGNGGSVVFDAWESILQQVELDAQSQAELANTLSQQICKRLQDRSFYRKVQARKVFSHRESFDILINKSEEKLAKYRQDYKAAHSAHVLSPSNASLLANYIESHNMYVRQLHYINGMVHKYTRETLPSLLQELQEVYEDICSSVTNSIAQTAEAISSRYSEQSHRYECVCNECQSVSSAADVTQFVKYVTPVPAVPHPLHRIRAFTYPFLNGENGSNSAEDLDAQSYLLPKNEIVVEHMLPAEIRDKADTLTMDANKLRLQMKQLQDDITMLTRMLVRNLDANSYTKVNELQEDISMKKYELKTAEIQLATLQTQIDLFNAKYENYGAEYGRIADRKQSTLSNTSMMKTKWLKAFKSLKTTSPPNGSPVASSTSKEPEKKSGKDGLQVGNPADLTHQFQEYTYKKITPCDVCSQVLRGHTRQGVRCKICKLNAHVDCQYRTTSPCQSIKSRLLRRQKSTSEIEARVASVQEEEADKLCTMSNNVVSANGQSGESRSVTWKNKISSSRQPSPNPPSNMTFQLAPHSPLRRRMNWRMKSISLDSSEPPDYSVAQCSPATGRYSQESHSAHSSTTHLLCSKPTRVNSAEITEEKDVSPSSSGNSPVPSPFKNQRLVPTNLYAVLFNFKARHADELDLKAGDKVTVIDKSDSDWWKGKCRGMFGYFPSKYVTSLQPGERVLQVTRNLHVSSADDSEPPIMLLHDQIIIQVGEGMEGMILFRTGDDQQGICPLEFLHEV